MPSVAEFLIERLENAGLKHVFGVPGDYILSFYNKVAQSNKIEIVNNTDENHSGFAADAYARAHGIGAVCATYSVGALKLCNAVAGAYAEKSPVIVISGSPGIKERNSDFLLHHVVRSFDNQQKMFKHITCASVILEDATKAGFLIDEAMEALMYYKQPIYIELPRDVADQPIKYDVYRQGTPAARRSDPENLKESISEVTDWIQRAKNPIIMAGVQVARFGLGREIVRFAEKHNIPMVTTLLSKSCINELHPLFLGVYAGNAATKEVVRKRVEDSDCLMIFGEMLTDMTLGFQSPKFDKRQTISCSVEGLKISNHSYNDVLFTDFIAALTKLELGAKPLPDLPPKEAIQPFVPKPSTKITTGRFFEKINTMLDENTAIVADIGECLFGAMELQVHHHHFLSPAFYCSMGASIPGALGLQLARPKLRPIVLIGDGAFQMAVTELSTILDRGLNPIVFVLNNHGYTTERFLLDGAFNNLRDWDYHKATEMLCGGVGAKVESEDDLVMAADAALASKGLSIINVVVDSKDTSPTLRRMAESLAKKV